MSDSLEHTTSPEEVLVAAFAVPRTPRSNAYKAGVLSVLKLRMNGQAIKHPYECGTAEADAYYAGQHEGHSLYAELIRAAQ
ncbi:hypothetical protein NG829_08350 [Xanthomonas sacchari]|uniref:Uncharacterized protein n=1 Tax=Xanthomonas sacchari TaxID=56458 RepID=A0ABT3DTB7_9XANT|nr:hypothetical protein [Xanthomonas sacchari]MCW0398746.1 hypothetical protein [Xanthomonas sacchari]MCW0418394.1 hypothetical protein [Xanthomonas sacchari]UYK72544.1 hypothetical protein NG828_20545 [Xanthomonas sacchari]UYK82286.1 hypothetical protein NG829_08350 [Xanthomonas sacchari]